MRLVFLSVLLLYSCTQTHTSVVSETDIEAYFQSTKKFTEYKEQVIDFYAKRNGAFIWFDKGLNEYGKEFLKRMQTDTTEANETGRLAGVAAKEYPSRRKPANDSIAARSDILFTLAFFEFADKNWVGFSKSEIRRSGWLIKPRTINVTMLLDSMLLLQPGQIASFDPVYKQHSLLKEKIREYSRLKEMGWNAVTAVKNLKPGDKDPLIAALRKNLFLLNDLKNDNASPEYDETFKNAIAVFQQRHGLEGDGIINDRTAELLEMQPGEVEDKLLVNLERCRWFPEQLTGDNIVVNVPAFELYVINNDKLQWKCNVVVGSDSTHTLIFNDVMEYVVFSPHWNIPNSIIYKETIPAIQADKNYLQKHNMEVVDKDGNVIDASDINWRKSGDEFEYTIRQKPGENNALGKVKFLLPNAHNIYLHDTPAKSLFGEDERAFSHGCVRVSEPMKLAQYILRDEPDWDENSIREAMNSGKERFVKLKRKVPVYLTYFTAWVDDEGRLQLRNDIYGHDRKTERML